MCVCAIVVHLLYYNNCIDIDFKFPAQLLVVLKLESPWGKITMTDLGPEKAPWNMITCKFYLPRLNTQFPKLSALSWKCFASSSFLFAGLGHFPSGTKTICRVTMNDFHEICQIQTWKEAQSILADPSHSLFNDFMLLPSSRGYVLPKYRTNRHKNSIPWSALHLLWYFVVSTKFLYVVVYVSAGCARNCLSGIIKTPSTGICPCFASVSLQISMQPSAEWLYWWVQHSSEWYMLWWLQTWMDGWTDEWMDLSLCVRFSF